MDNFRTDFAARTRKFAVRVIRLVESLPRTTSGFALGKQLVRSATSVGANFRSACRGRSTAEFVAKLGIAEEEADETVYWLELIVESGMVKESLVADLKQEANEIVAILVTSIKSARR